MGDAELDMRPLAETQETLLKGPFKGASPAEWLSTRARVALAAAVIKNKPPGMSGRQHAEALGGELQSRDESWRRRAQGLQQEVLRLRQELLLSRLTSDTRSSAEEAAENDSRPDEASQDLFGPGSDSETPDVLLPDSETPDLLLPDSETPDLLLPDSETPDLLLPDSEPQPPPPARRPGGRHGDTAFPQVQFLQSLCSLQRVEGGPEALWSSDGEAGSVLEETLVQLLDSVVAACRDPPALGPPDLVLRASRVAARAMELYGSRRMPSAEFRKRLEEPLREMTRMLLHQNQTSRPAAAETLTENLMALASSRISASFLIRHILSEISALAEQLWQARDGSGLDGFPVDRYHNSCRLFWMLEELLQRSEAACRVEVSSEQTGFLGLLERRVFLLSDEFPLFSIRMWRIGSLLADKGNTAGPAPSAQKM
ncbi:meiosis-specific protein MEI4 isoform X1 [Embiotoca jacksoni]|uniref:meiosis-specific protein MEI4 isoform X1 n=2 Tax=Embiotoca jacksoni TaxID=100190 RepID=UPI0037047E60